MLDILEKLKYQTEIKSLLDLGCPPPDSVETPDAKVAHRFVFKQTRHPKNHMPIFMVKPERVIQEKDKKGTSGYALSCFDSTEKAESFFSGISKTAKNFHKSVGDSIASGELNDSDGRITKASNVGHFDLYEFVDCNLNATFVVTKEII